MSFPQGSQPHHCPDKQGTSPLLLQIGIGNAIIFGKKRSGRIPRCPTNKGHHLCYCKLASGTQSYLEKKGQEEFPDARQTRDITFAIANWHRERNHIWKKKVRKNSPMNVTRHMALYGLFGANCPIPSLVLRTISPPARPCIPPCGTTNLKVSTIPVPFSCPSSFSHGGGAYRVRSRFPWKSFAMDVNQYRDPMIPPYPQSSKDLSFLWAEGPLWSKQRFKSQPHDVVDFNLAYSITLKKGVPSAIGPPWYCPRPLTMGSQSKHGRRNVSNQASPFF